MILKMAERGGTQRHLVGRKLRDKRGNIIRTVQIPTNSATRGDGDIIDLDETPNASGRQQDLAHP
jgi:hypothetical protein